ncbi:MAG: AAA family ATPase, partial [Candidatus Thermoplasmatota archaeon]
MIERLMVENYKSIEDIELKLHPFTVFIGPNNAGKSNVIDSLRFLRDLAEGANAVDARGGFSNIVWDGDIKRSIRMRLDGKLHMGESEKAYTYSLAIAGGPAHYGISNENFSVRVDGEERKLMVFPEKGDAAQFYDEK